MGTRHGMATWLVTAEHSCGQSVSHPCSHGVYADPTEDFEEEVHAKTESVALEFGRLRLQSRAERADSCACRRNLRPGSNSWWNSVCFRARLVAVDETEVLAEEKDDGTVGISSEAHPGCVVVGDDVDDAIALWRDAIAAHTA